jgi:hypothetical protein
MPTRKMAVLLTMLCLKLSHCPPQIIEQRRAAEVRSTRTGNYRIVAGWKLLLVQSVKLPNQTLNAISNNR